MTLTRYQRIASAIVLVATCGVVTTCRSPAVPDPAQAIFRVRACAGSLTSPDGEVFRVLLRDSGLIARARALTGTRKIVAGKVVAGDGGFNSPWSWHLDPNTVQFPDVSIEVCDACPSYLEANLSTWTGAMFCPWSAEILGEQK